MPLTPPRAWRIDYATLPHYYPQGRCVGTYAGHLIRDVIVDDSGRQYTFAGIAPRIWDGSIDVDALAAGEFIVPPGLVYRLNVKPAPWWRRLI